MLTSFKLINFRESLTPHVQTCIRCYTSDWHVVKYQHRLLSSSAGNRQSIPKPLYPSPRQEFEIDFQQQTPSESTSELGIIYSLIKYLLIN